MNVAIVGGGAREHALVRAIRRSRDLGSLVVAPGNAGIERDARCVAVRAEDVEGLVALASREQIDLVVVGPEAPLVVGLADALRSRGISVFGPGAHSARLEGSKAFAKQFMASHGIPTAPFEIFDDADAADRFVRTAGRALVVKADGLAAGKGVVVAADAAEAHEAIDRMMRRGAFGDAGRRVVIEEQLAGEEISLHVLTDGVHATTLGAAQDHKRIGDGDRGPNTGGMGAYTPVPAFTDALRESVQRDIVEPTVAGLAKDGIAYRGVLFIGLMVAEGRANVLEYNVRFGDPECAVLLERMDCDVLAVLSAIAGGNLAVHTIPLRSDAVIAVVMAARGYPNAPITGDAIEGLDGIQTSDEVAVLHAGTRRDAERIVTAGGRVLTVVARGANLDVAAKLAYGAADRIRFDGAQYRRDIGHRARRGFTPLA